MAKGCALLMDQVDRIREVESNIKKLSDEIDSKQIKSPVNSDLKFRVLKMLAYSTDDKFRKLLNDIVNGAKSETPLLVSDIMNRLKKEVNWKEGKDTTEVKKILIREVMMNAGEKINFDVIDKNILDDIIKDAINGAYTVEQVKLENPLLRIFKGIVTLNHHYDEFASKKLSKELGFEEGLEKAYLSGDTKAKQWIDGFKVVGDTEDSITKVRKHFDKIYNEMLEKTIEISRGLKSKGKYTTGLQVKDGMKTLKTEEAIKFMEELIGEDGKRELFDKLYRISNLNDYGDKITEFGKTSVVYGKKSFDRTFVSEEKTFSEKIIFVDEILNSGMNMRFLKTSGSKDILNFVLPNKEKFGLYESILKEFNSGFNDKNLLKIHKSMDSFDLTIKSIYDHKIKGIGDLINDDSDYLGFIINDINKSTEMGKILRESFGIKDNEVFLGTFGDKDSLYQIYSYDGFNKFFTKKGYDVKDLHKELLKLADIEYKLRLGFKGQGSISWETFQKQLNKEIKKPIGSVDRTIEFFNNWAKDKDIKDLFGLKTQGVVKRESSFMSNYKTFRGFAKKMYMYVLEKYKEKDFVSYENLFNTINKATVTKEEVQNFVQQLKMLDPDIKKSNIDSNFIVVTGDTFNRTQSLLNIADYLSKVYGVTSDVMGKKIDYVDMEDGYSVLSRGLGNERARINGYGKSHGHFKDHFRDTVNGEQMFSKTLWNIHTVKDMDGEIIEGGFTGKSSLKLGSDNLEVLDKDITLQGDKRKLVGRYETTTEGFINATSDSSKVYDEVTLPLQILNQIPYKFRLQIEDYFKKEIDDIFLESMKNLGDVNALTLNAGAMNDVILSNIRIKSGVGNFNDSAINNILYTAFDKAKAFLESPKVGGTTVIMQKSARYIKADGEIIYTLGRQEVLISKTNPVAKLEIEKQRKAFQDSLENTFKKPYADILLDDTIESEIKTFKLKDIYVTTYRNPIPNVENFGVSKAVFIEDLNKIAEERGLEFDITLKKDEAITHPESTFVKMEADHDGDKMQLVSIDSELGDIIGKSVLDYDNKDLVTRLGNAKLVDYLRDGGEFITGFNIIKPVEDAGEKKIIENIYGSELIKARLGSLRSKKNIDIFMATKRTLDVVKQLHQGWVNGTLTSDSAKELLTSGKDIVKYGEQVTLENIFARFGLTKESIIDEKLYKQTSSQLAQDTLDASKSDKEFNKFWIKDLLLTFNPNIKVDKGLVDVISGISQRESIEKVKINDLIKGTDVEVPSIKRTIFNYLSENHKQYIKDVKINSGRRFMYDNYMGNLFGERAGKILEDGSMDLTGKDTRKSIQLGTKDSKGVWLDTFYSEFEKEFPKVKEKNPSGFMFFKTNLPLSIKSDGYDSLTNFLLIKKFLNYTVAKINDSKFLKENGITISNKIQKRNLKEAFDYIDDLNKLVDEEKISKGDIIGDEDFLKKYNKLDDTSKSFVVSKLLAYGHNRFAKMLSESDLGKYVLTSQSYYLDKFNDLFKGLNDRMGKLGDTDGKQSVTEVIPVDMGDDNAIKLSIIELSNLSDNEKKLINSILDKNPDLKDALQKYPGDRLSEKINNLMEDLQLECK